MPAAQSAFTAARAETEKIVRAQPRNEKPLSVLALIDAHLGRKEKAIEEGRTACDILGDEGCGRRRVADYESCQSICDHRREGSRVEQLEIVTKLPGSTYGELQLAPESVRLRGDPRFHEWLVFARTEDISSRPK